MNIHPWTQTCNIQLAMLVLLEIFRILSPWPSRTCGNRTFPQENEAHVRFLVRIASAKSPKPRQKRWVAFIDEICRIRVPAVFVQKTYELLPPKVNMSSKKGTMSMGKYIIQPLIVMGACSFLGVWIYSKKGGWNENAEIFFLEKTGVVDSDYIKSRSLRELVFETKYPSSGQKRVMNYMFE